MGRYSTGAISTDASKRISISFLKKHGCFEPECLKHGTINFSMRGEPTGSISISSDTNDKPYLQLTYTKTDNNTGEKSDIDYKVMLVKVPSNLGRGFRYYFLCPFSHKRCETLYMAYGSLYFKHREAYRYRIYYPCQMESKRGLCFRYLSIERQIEELCMKQVKNHYKGFKTRLVKRIRALERKYEYYSGLAEERLEERLFEMMKKYGVQ